MYDIIEVRRDEFKNGWYTQMIGMYLFEDVREFLCVLEEAIAKELTFVEVVDFDELFNLESREVSVVGNIMSAHL